jgi:hypothetical protein
LKKIYILILAFNLTLGSFLMAKPSNDFYISNYEVIDLDFLRTHYQEIENGRPIQFEAHFSSYKWLKPFDYKERLGLIGFNANDYNLLQMTLKEKDDFHYSFPILLFHSQIGELREFEQLTKGERVKVYGRFFNLKKSEYAIEADVIETIQKGGHDRAVLVDGRLAPTWTPTATVTNTPGPNLWQRINNAVNPKETATPTGTVTPEPGK